jgi:hypothetical protein
MATITHEATQVNISAGRWDAASYAGTHTVLRELGPHQRVAPTGSTGQINGVNRITPGYQNATGINYTTAGFDPVLQAYFQQLYEVRLLTTGQIWPVGFN